MEVITTHIWKDLTSNSISEMEPKKSVCRVRKHINHLITDTGGWRHEEQFTRELVRVFTNNLYKAKLKLHRKRRSLEFYIYFGTHL